MSWTELRKTLKDLPPAQLLDLLKGLHNLSPQNKAWLEAQLAPKGDNSAYLEECRKKVIKLVYNPARNFPARPRFSDAKKVISDYKKTSRDPIGTLDLMLTYLERGHAFTNDFGDIDMPFYDALINMLDRFSAELMKSAAQREMYEHFRSRLLAINRTASNIGWGYGDAVHEAVAELEALLDE